MGAATPIRRDDVIRDDLERIYHRAYDEWEFVTGIAAEKPELRSDPVWKGLENHLAHRADRAWQDLEDYNAPEAL